MSSTKWDWTPGEVRFIIGMSAIDVYVFISVSGQAPRGASGWHYKSFPKSVGMTGILDRMRRKETNPPLWQQMDPPGWYE